MSDKSSERGRGEVRKDKREREGEGGNKTRDNGE